MGVCFKHGDAVAHGLNRRKGSEKAMASQPKNPGLAHDVAQRAAGSTPALSSYAAHFIALEPRMMFDGAAIVGAVDTLAPADPAAAGTILFDIDLSATAWSPIADQAGRGGWSPMQGERVIMGFSQALSVDTDPVRDTNGRLSDHRNADARTDVAIAESDTQGMGGGTRSSSSIPR